MQKWEYLSVQVAGSGTNMLYVSGWDEDNPGQHIWKPANDLGSEGWELVSVATETGVFRLYGFFKRPIPAPAVLFDDETPYQFLKISEVQPVELAK